MSLYEKAAEFAAQAHSGQVDKIGVAYIQHPLAVANAVRHLGDEVMAAAVMHDVVEDCPVSLEDLKAAGFPDRVVSLVDALTRRPSEKYFEYIQRVKESGKDAIAIKIADIKHNDSPARSAPFGGHGGSMHQRYQKALQILTASTKIGLRTFKDFQAMADDQLYLCHDKKIAAEHHLESPFPCGSRMWMGAGLVRVEFHSNLPEATKQHQWSAMTELKNLEPVEGKTWSFSYNPITGSKFWEDLTDEQKQQHRDSVISALQDLEKRKYPFDALFGNHEKVSVLGPVNKFEPYASHPAKNTQPASGGQMMCQRQDGQHVIMLAGQLFENGKPLLPRGYKSKAPSFWDKFTADPEKTMEIKASTVYDTTIEKIDPTDKWWLFPDGGANRTDWHLRDVTQWFGDEVKKENEGHLPSQEQLFRKAFDKGMIRYSPDPPDRAVFDLGKLDSRACEIINDLWLKHNFNYVRIYAVDDHIDRGFPKENFEDAGFNVCKMVRQLAAKKASGQWQDVITDKETGMPFYDTFLDKPDLKDYFRYYKGYDWAVKMMSPEQYLDAVAEMHGSYSVEQGKLDRLRKLHQEGAVFPMPVLDYTVGRKGTQEGRHRAYLAQELGIKQIPVFVIHNIEPDPQKWEDIKEQKSRHASSWKDFIRGEYWIDADGYETFADSSVGDQGHESLAEAALVGPYMDEIVEALELWNLQADEQDRVDLADFDPDSEYAANWLFESIKHTAPDDIMEKILGADKWKLMKKDPRLAYMKYENAIMVVGNNFAVWKLDDNAIKRMQDFLFDEVGEQQIEAVLHVEEVETKNYSMVLLNDFLNIKYPGEFWKLTASILTAKTKEEWMEEFKTRKDITPEIMKYMETIPAKAGPWFDWIAREMKAKRLVPQELRDYINYGIAFFWGHFADWAKVKHPNIQTMKWKAVLEAIDKWDLELAQSGKGPEVDDYEEHNIVFKFKNGWSIQQVKTENDLDVEGKLMGHCVGSYADVVKRGNSFIYSLRDGSNQPHATIEMNNLHSSTSPEIVQIQGKQNNEPVAEYKKMIKEWLSTLKNPTGQSENIGSFSEWVDVSDSENEYGLTYVYSDDWDYLLTEAIKYSSTERGDYYVWKRGKAAIDALIDQAWKMGQMDKLNNAAQDLESRIYDGLVTNFDYGERYPDEESVIDDLGLAEPDPDEYDRGKKDSKFISDMKAFKDKVKKELEKAEEKWRDDEAESMSYAWEQWPASKFFNDLFSRLNELQKAEAK